MSRKLWFSTAALVLAVLIANTSGTPAAEIDLRGIWYPESYLLNDGSTHDIDGLVFFGETEWSFLVFVVADGTPLRGEGEGGTYAWDGDELVFTHNFILLAGEEVGSLPDTPLRMEVERGDAATTACQVTLEDDRLTIRFGPSGNAMVFRRASTED